MGVGKTFFALSCAYAVATGQSFLKFNAPSPRKVLYIDGEMPAPTMQQRIEQMINSDSKVDIPLKIITPDLQPKNQRSINLSDPRDQVAIASLVEESDLIIIDSISTLVRGGRENEAESWIPVQEWALNQRANGRSVLFIHHSGKGGAQRGTSRREDVLDTVIGLRRPAEYNPEDGAVFEVHFAKSRGFIGDDAKPFEARLTEGERGDYHEHGFLFPYRAMSPGAAGQLLSRPDGVFGCGCLGAAPPLVFARLPARSGRIETSFWAWNVLLVLSGYIVSIYMDKELSY